MKHSTYAARWLAALTSIAACTALACSPATPTDPNVPDDTTGPAADPSAEATAPASNGGDPKEEITGAEAPDFTLPTLDGDSVSLSDYRGKVVLLDFWATFCDPCLAEMPELVELYDKHKAEGLVVLAVSIDDPDTAAKVPATVKKYKMSFPVLLDEDGSTAKRYNPTTKLPFTMVIARNGVIVGKRAGYQPGDVASMKQLLSWIDRALAAK